MTKIILYPEPKSNPRFVLAPTARRSRLLFNKENKELVLCQEEVLGTTYHPEQMMLCYVADDKVTLNDFCIHNGVVKQILNQDICEFANKNKTPRVITSTDLEITPLCHISPNELPYIVDYYQRNDGKFPKMILEMMEVTLSNVDMGMGRNATMITPKSANIDPSVDDKNEYLKVPKTRSDKSVVFKSDNDKLFVEK